MTNINNAPVALLTVLRYFNMAYGTQHKLNAAYQDKMQPVAWRFTDDRYAYTACVVLFKAPE